MDDDFNAQNAMTAVYELIELANLYSQAEEVKTDTVNFVLKQIKDLMNVFGVDGLEQAPLLDADVDALIKERDAARETSNFARSDEIRDELASRGIILEDTPQGTRWRRA